MIRYKEIGFVAYPTTDIARARKFYEGALGLTPSGPVKAEDKWLEYNIGAAGTLGLGESPNWPPSKEGPSVALEVEDFPAAVETLRANGVELVMGPMETPRCHMVVFRDPDGNRLTLHKRK